MAQSVVIKIVGDDKEYKATLNDSKKATSAFSSTVVKGAALAAAAIAVITTGVIAVTKAYAIQEQAQRRTIQTLESTGYAAGVTSDEVFKLASSLQEVTTFGDEATIAAANILLTFKNLSKDVLPQVTELTLDVATAMGQDAKSSAIQLGKALNDPTVGLTALTRTGITFTNQQKDQIKTMQASGDLLGAQNIILKELESQFGGVARAAAGGTGVYSQLGNELGDIAELIGEKLSPYLTTAAAVFRDAAKAVKEFLSTDKGNIEEVTGEVTKLDAEIARLQAKIKDVNENPLKARLAGFDEGRLLAQLEDVKKTRLSFQADLDAQIEEKAKAARGKAAVDAAAADLQTTKDKMAAAAEAATAIEQSKLDARLAFAESNLEGDELELEQELIKQEKLTLIKKEADIKTLANAQKFGKAKSKLEANETKVTISEIQARIAAEQMLATTKLSILQNTAALAAQVLGAENKAAFLLTKAAATASAIVNIAQGVTGALALGPIAGPPLATGIKIAGGIQLATIAASTIQGFEEGGVIGGFNGATVGGDNRVATVRDGEMVLNPRQQKNVFEAIDGDNLGGAGGGNISVTVKVVPDEKRFFKAMEKQILTNRANGTSKV